LFCGGGAEFCARNLVLEMVSLNCVNAFGFHYWYTRIISHETASKLISLLLILQLYFSEGGSPDPNFNVQLSSTIEQARRYNMPLVSIQNAIKQGKVTDNRTFILIVQP
jgi:hypothetical protein